MTEETEVVEAEAVEDTPPKKKIGRRSIAEINAIRTPLGFKEKKKSLPTVDKRAILPKKRENRQREILAQMLSKKSKYVVNKIIEKALDDENPDQMACLKIIADRIIPVDYFTKDKSGARNGINIQIVGVGGETIQVVGTDSGVPLEDDSTLIEGEIVE